MARLAKILFINSLDEICYFTFKDEARGFDLCSPMPFATFISHLFLAAKQSSIGFCTKNNRSGRILTRASLRFDGEKYARRNIQSARSEESCVMK